MDEYIVDVVIDGKDDKLKTYCSSIYSAVDTMIGMDMVEEIKSITRTKDDNIETKKIDELICEQCATMGVIHYDYSRLAGYLSISNHHKETYKSFFSSVDILYKKKR